MPLAALGLVLAAALLHATWNLLAKRGGQPLVFLWWTGVVGLVVWLPPLLLGGAGSRPSAEAWIGALAAAVLRAAYFAALAGAYRRGDLSVVYPVARGIAPALTVVTAVTVLGERLSTGAALGLAALVVGLYVTPLPALDVRVLLAPISTIGSAGLRFALLTGTLTAAYSVVDKWTMDRGFPVGWYAYLTIPGAALLLTPLVWSRPGWRAGWRAQRESIVAVAVLMVASYIMILGALTMAPVSRVAPAREIGIVFGAGLGVAILREPHGRPRLVGAALIVLGVVLLATAPPG